MPSELSLWTDSIVIAHDFVSRGGGSSLHTIAIGDGMDNEVRNGRSTVGDFRKACPNVHSPSAADKSGAWASPFRGKLGKLQVVGTFPKFCPSLVELKFTSTEYRPSDFMSTYWEYMGSNLETLILSRVSALEGKLKVMRKKLVSLAF